LIPKGLIVGISIGVIASAIFGLVLTNFKNNVQLQYEEGLSLSILTEKIDFDAGEEIIIKIVNSGTVPITFSDGSYGLEITGLDGRVLYSPIAVQVISTLEPKEEITFTWDQFKNDGEQITLGRYKIISTGQFIHEGGQSEFVKSSVTINVHK
jgi:hypothetical protein